MNEKLCLNKLKLKNVNVVYIYKVEYFNRK